MDAINQALETYLEHKEVLAETSLGKYAVIHGKAILMVFDTHSEAVDLVKTTKLTEAIIKRIVIEEPILQVLHHGSVVEFSSRKKPNLPDKQGSSGDHGPYQGKSRRESTAENPKIASFG